MRWFTCLGMIVLVTLLSAGCAGDEKGSNQNKEKPQPASK